MSDRHKIQNEYEGETLEFLCREVPPCSYQQPMQIVNHFGAKQINQCIPFARLLQSQRHFHKRSVIRNIFKGGQESLASKL